MGDGELEIAGKFGLPEWGGFAAQIEGRFKRNWSDRSVELVEQTSDLLGISADALGELLAADDRRLDLFAKALRRAADEADPAYREALARLIAAACDESKIDAAAYAASRVLKCESVELRGFKLFFMFRESGIGVTPERPPAEAGICSLKTRTSKELAAEMDVDLSFVGAIIETLVSMGLISALPITPLTRVRERTPLGGTITIVRWEPTDLGKLLIRVLYPDLYV